jgi:hypothetical protein
MSSHFEKLGKEVELKKINFDLDVYRNAIDGGSKEIFHEMFPYEII